MLSSQDLEIATATTCKLNTLVHADRVASSFNNNNNNVWLIVDFVLSSIVSEL